MARRIVVLMQATLDNRIATGEGAFREPFRWGEPETRHINEVVRRADTRAMSRVLYEASGSDRTVLTGDLAAHLADLEQGPGGDVLLSCGPRTLAPLAATPGLVDAYVLAGHPVVVPPGPAPSGPLDVDLALETTAATRFGSGGVVLQYRVLSS